MVRRKPSFFSCGPAALGLALAFGCAPRGPSGTAVQVPASAPEASPKAAPRGALPPATPEEQELAGRLRSTVEHLSVEIGERNPGRSWNLASATDDLARAL